MRQDPSFTLSRVAAALGVVLLAACSTDAAPSASPTAAGPTPTATADPEARDAFGAAICPVFTSILELDPRLAALRQAGGSGGDVSDQAEEAAAVSDEMADLLADLDGVPDWTPGNDLRLGLTNALHGIRAHLLAAGEDPSARDLSEIPFIASEAMDRAMAGAVGAGLTCEGTPG